MLPITIRVNSFKRMQHQQNPMRIRESLTGPRDWRKPADLFAQPGLAASRQSAARHLSRATAAGQWPMERLADQMGKGRNTNRLGRRNDTSQPAATAAAVLRPIDSRSPTTIAVGTTIRVATLNQIAYGSCEMLNRRAASNSSPTMAKDQRFPILCAVHAPANAATPHAGTASANTQPG